MIHRWRSHVDGWTLGVPEQLRSHVTFIRFRDLSANYEQVMRTIGQNLGPPKSIERPALQESSVLPNKGKVGDHVEYFDDDDLALFRDIAGSTMDRLGYR